MLSPLSRRLAALTLFLAGGLLALAEPARWADTIDRLTAHDTAHPPPADSVVFIGSSSIVMWTTLAADFPNIPVIKRGFGGSELADSIAYEDRLVLAYRPRAVVLYAGDNDIAAGKSAETVAADFRTFRDKLHAALPHTQLFFLSIKLSLARASLRAEMERANRLIAADCVAHPACTFVDVSSPLLDAQGRPRPEFFRTDGLHLTPAGYARWTAVLRPLLQPFASASAR